MLYFKRLPIDCRSSVSEATTVGFELGTNIDKLWRNAKYPSGWITKPSDHYLYTDIYDELNRKRGLIMYKGGLYDNDAYWRLNCRYVILCESIVDSTNYNLDVCYMVKDMGDGEQVLWHSEEIPSQRMVTPLGLDAFMESKEKEDA